MAGKPAWMCMPCWTGGLCRFCTHGEGTRCSCRPQPCRCLPHDEAGRVLAAGPGCLLALLAVAVSALRGPRA